MGADNMQKAIEDYANELAKELVQKYAEEYFNKQVTECVKRMLDGGIPLKTALKCANMDLQTYEKYSGKVQ